MKKILLLNLIIFSSVFSQTERQYIKQIKKDVKFLSSDELEGRKTGTIGEKKAYNYIIDRYKELNLTPKGEDGYKQSFSISKNKIKYSDLNTPIFFDTLVYATNVIAFKDNNAPKTIVIGAHYDHIGFGIESSLSPDLNVIHNGADDNASGVALILYLADIIDSKEYNYLYIAFSGEEEGLWGSSYFTKNPTIDLNTISCMINLDMVGRLDKKLTLAVNGTGTAKEWDSLIEESNNLSFNLVKSESGLGASDHTSFYLIDIPSLHFFTGQHDDYHKYTDDYNKVNFNGIKMIADYINKIISNSDSFSEFGLTFQKTKDTSNTHRSFSVTLGVMPDYLYDKKGMRIDKVREGKVAFNHGFKDGDIVIKMGDIQIVDMMSYMKALGVFEKGDSIIVKVLRENKEIDLEVTF